MYYNKKKYVYILSKGEKKKERNVINSTSITKVKIKQEETLLIFCSKRKTNQRTSQLFSIQV